MAHYEVHHANCFEWLREQQPPLSIHGVCTDPPFGIVEFLPHEMAKLRSGRGGVWRIPPAIGGSQRAPLPRFTTLSVLEREHVRVYFREFGEALMPALVPGAHVFLAGTPMLQHLVQTGMAEAGYEVRGAIMRLYRGFRGGDRPKLAEQEFADVCVTPRGAYEPWMLFRKPIGEKTVAQNLRKWGIGALRRLSVDQPLPDIIQSGKTPLIEEAISDHPTLKPHTRQLKPLTPCFLLQTRCGNPIKMLLPTKVKVPMKLPPLLDTRFAQFLQVLPADYHEQAYAFKAFARPRKIKSPLQLLQLVLAYCGLDLSLRSCAGEVAQRQGYLSDTAVKKDWRLVFRG